jgi:hypothetical protein
MNISQGPHYIDDTLTFSVTTHDVATGALTDADAVPAYRVYEDEIGTAILTGNMAKLDDANTTGFYTEQITLSAANGFEAGKSYQVYASAAVDSVTGGTSGSFRMSGTHPATVSSGGITTASFAAGAINAAAIANGAIDAATFAADVDQKFGILATGTLQSATATTAVLAAALSYADDIIVGATLVITGGTGAGQRRIITDYVGATDTATVDTWTTTPDNTSTYNIYGSAAGASLADIASEVRTELTTELDEIGSILADTNELQADWANGGRLDLILDARASQASVDDLPTNAELATSQAAADDATLAAIAAVDAKIDIIDTNVDQIETLLGETDTDVAAIKAKTDSLTFTEAGVVDANANVTHINDVEVTGDGALTPWGPAA